MIHGSATFARLSLLAALSLPALIFYPHAQHVFWASERFSSLLLIPPAALLAWQHGRKAEGLEAGKALFQVLAGLWLLSAAFSTRLDLAARELAAWSCPALIFFAVSRMAREELERRRIAAILLSSGAVLGIYGLIQSAGLEPSLAAIIKRAGQATGLPTFGFETLNWAVSYGGRAGSFLGNPNFLGGHLALLLPLSVALALDDRKRALKILGWAAALLCAAGLIVSQTRGAWAGAAIGLAATLWLSHKRMPGLMQRNRKGLILLTTASLIGLAAFFAAHSQNLGRLSSVFKGDEELSRRATLMKAALHMAARDPLLGVGPGNYRIFFPTVQLSGVDKGKEAEQPYIYSEHAHNDLIQMAAECGFPAALAFIALIAWVLRRLYQDARRDPDPGVEREEAGKDPLLVCGAFGGLLALLIHGQANFPFLILPTQCAAWAIAALALAKGEGERPRAEAAPWKRPALILGWMGYLALALLAGRGLHEDAMWWVGQGEISLGNNKAGKEIVLKALGLNPGRREDRLWYQHGMANLADNMTANAMGSLKEAVRLNPHYVEARVQLGRAYTQLGQWKEARETLQEAARFAPNFAPVWEPLAAALFMTQDYEQAVLAYDWALAFDPANAPELMDNKAAALGNLGRLTDAIAVLLESERKNPARAKVHLNKAITYLKMGMKEPARNSLKQAKALDPNDPQIPALQGALR